MPRFILVAGEPDAQRRTEARRRREYSLPPSELLAAWLLPHTLGAVDDRQARGARWLLERAQHRRGEG